MLRLNSSCPQPVLLLSQAYLLFGVEEYLAMFAEAYSAAMGTMQVAASPCPFFEPISSIHISQSSPVTPSKLHP